MPYTETIQKLQTALAETVAEIDHWCGMPEESRAYQPQDGGWSINEILEHITLTSHYLLIIINKGCAKALRKAAQGETIPAGESDLTRLEPIGHPDAFPWIRPEHMEPTRKVALEEVRARVQEQYQNCVRVLTDIEHGEGALYTARMSVQDLGRMDLYQWLYFLVLHQQRHIRQIARVYQEWETKHP
ncbi:DinB family protein [Dictyobacter formicarum]|uniref:PadR family transcriptional regulator n=1 Tax=Dictyobacter formicarum TaxID=2778368 RepID=A0ABQ3VQZ9_9CHLR|nr:DinB family protein [Dictyobacter formicarum]GHO88692.1 PadR family transcriptional regulator [Dictyobacter formicarum]